MSYEKEVISFLCKPDNVKIAIEVGEKIDEVKKQLKLRFWNSVQEKLTQNLNKNRISTWVAEATEIMIPSKRCLKLLNKTDLNYIYLYLSHENERLFLGIEWKDNEITIPQSLNEVNCIMNDLREDGFKEKDIGYDTHKIYAWKWLDYYLNDSSTLHSIASNDSIATDASNVLWCFFELKRQMIENANAAIAKLLS